MSPRSPVRLFCGSVVLAALALSGLAAPHAHFGWILAHPASFLVMTAGVLLGEMLPIHIPRRNGSDEELTLSAAFALALLIVGGLGPALLAQCFASAVPDVVNRKTGWRTRFNVGQYALAMLATSLVVHLIAGDHPFAATGPFASGQLLALLVGSLAFFLVNRIVVGIAVAVYQGGGVLAYFRENAAFGVVTGGIILLTAPIVLAAAAYTVFIVPLCLAPIVAMYRALSQSAHSQHLALHDPLTGLPNRMAFGEAAARATADRRVPACVLLVDLDRFKEVNDTLGHRFGDLLLVQVAQRFQAVVGARGEIARFGGDEFAVICADIDAGGARTLAAALIDTLGRPFRLEDLTVDTQASIGIACFPTDGTSIETLLQKADVAMYQAKESRSQLALYDERHDHYNLSRLAITGELRAAIADGQITVAYQPQIDFRSGEVAGVEALVRWCHPTLGMLAPADFIATAEQSNLIKPLTLHVIELVLAQSAVWRAAGRPTPVAVNISPQVLVDRDFTREVLAALTRRGAPPQDLRLEVTESALMSDPDTAAAVLGELDAAGVQIAIDDFGTGYSSLAYLADLPVSEVKIDQSFVARMSEHASERIIVSSTIDLAHHLGLRAVAEGVETPRHMRELRALGCDVAQGFAIARPLPGPEVTRWLVEHDDAVSGVPEPAPDRLALLP